MKTLVSVAVYGLVPLPPMPERLKGSCEDLQTTSADSLPITERLATQEELARYATSSKRSRAGGEHPKPDHPSESENGS
jgi:hypothetical protein